MKTLAHSFRLCLLSYVMVLAGTPAFGQSWTPTGAPSNSWAAVACSADGARLVAATSISSTNGQILTSIDGGANWGVSSAPSLAWKFLVSSADGTRLAALAQSTAIYRSTNSGITWSSAGMSGQCLGSSADGSILTTAAYNGQVYLLTNFGSTWTPRNTPMYDVVNSICSASGSKLAAGNNNGQFSTSTNSGVNWSKVSSTGAQVRSLAASADLTMFIAASSLTFGSRDWIVTSKDMGQSWITNNLPPANIWAAVATSADGSKLVAAASGGTIYSSTNGGATWISNDVPALHWQSVAMTADGSTVFAAASNGGIWAQRNIWPPRVQIAGAGNSLDLSWIVPAATFKLQETQELNPPAWMDVTNSPTLNSSNLNDEVSLPFRSSGFYRLQTR